MLKKPIFIPQSFHFTANYSACDEGGDAGDGEGRAVQLPDGGRQRPWGVPRHQRGDAPRHPGRGVLRAQRAHHPGTHIVHFVKCESDKTVFRYISSSVLEM